MYMIMWVFCGGCWFEGTFLYWYVPSNHNGANTAVSCCWWETKRSRDIQAQLSLASVGQKRKWNVSSSRGPWDPVLGLYLLCWGCPEAAQLCSPVKKEASWEYWGPCFGEVGCADSRGCSSRVGPGCPGAWVLLWGVGRSWAIAVQSWSRRSHVLLALHPESGNILLLVLGRGGAPKSH